MARGMNDTFLEKSVGEMLLAQPGKSAAGILQAAAERGELRPDIDVDAAVSVVYVQMIPLIDVQFLPHLNHYFLLLDDPPSFARVRDAALALIVKGLT